MGGKRVKRENFIKCAEYLREYARWEKKMYDCDIDLAYTPANNVVGALQLAMCDFNDAWSYDEQLEFDWIVEWVYEDSPNYFQKRHGVEFDLTDAGALYDFLVFMNEHGWED